MADRLGSAFNHISGMLYICQEIIGNKTTSLRHTKEFNSKHER